MIQVRADCIWKRMSSCTNRGTKKKKPFATGWTIYNSLAVRYLQVQYVQMSHHIKRVNMEPH